VCAANTGGAATLVGDPPNVILGTTLGFNFADFATHTGPISAIASLLLLGMFYLTNRKTGVVVTNGGMHGLYLLFRSILEPGDEVILPVRGGGTFAVVLADAGRGDWVLCQVTSNPYGDPHAVSLTTSSFSSGSLRAESYARPGKLFTASSELMVAQVAILNADARQQIVEAVVAILRAGALR
jgi:mRNA interferase MazF